MALTSIIEIALSVLLVATLIYCALLERRLAGLRKGQDMLKNTIGELNEAITYAGASMRALRSAASSAGEALDERLTRARALADELSLLAASGERIADRIVGGASAAASKMVSNDAHPASLGTRLEALKPAVAMRPELPMRPQLPMRNVR